MSSTSVEQFRSEQRLRNLKDRLPRRERGRGCLGLAALLNDVERTTYWGDRCLIPNECVTWLALRDLPPGHRSFRDCRAKQADFADTAVAELRYGMPLLDFARVGRDGRDCGSLSRSDELTSLQEQHTGAERELKVVERLSDQMTRFARCAVDHGHPLRPKWHRVHPPGWEPFPPERPERWFPVPYLAFSKEAASHLFWTATEATPTGSIFRCPSCDRTVHSVRFGEPRCQSTFPGEGSVIARCYFCGARRRWELKDATAARVRQRFGSAFRVGFCGAIERGLPLASTESNVYLGPVRAAENVPGLIAHTLRSTIDGIKRCISLPPSAQVLARTNQQLEAGETWCRILPIPSRKWRKLRPECRWSKLPEICGGTAGLRHLQRLWFESEMLGLAEHPELLLVRADLAGPGCRNLPPVGLWWDFGPAVRYVDGLLEAAIFPAIPIGARHLRLGLHDVLINAGMPDIESRSVRPGCHRTTQMNRSERQERRHPQAPCAA